MSLQLSHKFCNKPSGISSIQDFISDMIKLNSDDWILALTTNMIKYAEIHLDIERWRCFHLMGGIIFDYEENKRIIVRLFASKTNLSKYVELYTNIFTK